MPMTFKARVKETLIANVFYCVDKFMAHNWET